MAVMLDPEQVEPPYACRSLPQLFRALSEMTENDDYLGMPRNYFIGKVMQKCGGSVNPRIVSEYYDQLMIDAYGQNYEARIKPRS